MSYITNTDSTMVAYEMWHKNDPTRRLQFTGGGLFYTPTLDIMIKNTSKDSALFLTGRFAILTKGDVETVCLQPGEQTYLIVFLRVIMICGEHDSPFVEECIYLFPPTPNNWCATYTFDDGRTVSYNCGNGLMEFHISSRRVDAFVYKKPTKIWRLSDKGFLE